MGAPRPGLAEARTTEFRDCAQQVVDNATALRRQPPAVRLVTGGTDNHRLLVDVSAQGLTGRQAEAALLDAGIVTNRNAVLHDPNGAWYASGIRLGTPALTARGRGTSDMDQIAALIHTVLVSTRPGAGPDGNASRAGYILAPTFAAAVAEQAADLVAAHPLYPTVNIN